MCCGRSHATIASTITSIGAPTGAQARQGIAPAGPTAPTSALFEYKGATALTVVSPLTGKTYRFAQPGARVGIDPRDRSWVSFVPQLARVATSS